MATRHIPFGDRDGQHLRDATDRVLDAIDLLATWAADGQEGGAQVAQAIASLSKAQVALTAMQRIRDHASRRQGGNGG